MTSQEKKIENVTATLEGLSYELTRELQEEIIGNHTVAEILSMIQNKFNILLTTALEEQREEIVKLVEETPNATRDECQNEKVICASDITARITSDKTSGL